MFDFSDEQVERYSRHIILPEVGGEGQSKLLESKVLLIGAGGLGSPAAYYLAAAGIGNMGIIDFDTVDLSNLQRQIIHNTERIGMLKTESAKLEKLCDKIEGGKLSEKMLIKATDQSAKQQKVVKKMISGLGLSNDIMDETIEKIYGIAAEFREAGKQERVIEKQLKMSLAGVKKLAKNWRQNISLLQQ